jgi:ABC-type multidrug transport system fused ATPase/permease subunit
MKELIDNLKFTWKYLKNTKHYFYLYLIMNLCFIVISLVVPIISAKIIIYLTSNNFYQLFMMSIVIFIIENIRSIVDYFAIKCTQHIYRETMINLQYDLASNILKLENKIIDDNGSGLFIQRLTNDTSRMSDIFNNLATDIGSTITDLGIFIAIFLINKIVFIYLVIMIIILYLIESIRTKKRNENDKIYRKEKEKVSGFIGELVRGSRDIKMLNSEDSFLTELYGKVKKANQTGYDMSDVNRKFRLLGGVY